MTESDLPRTSELNRRLSIMGVAAYCRVSGRETGGAYSVMEHIFAPGTGPAFLHMHPAQETVMIRDGTFETYSRGASGKETKRLGPGEIHHIPSKIPHGLKNVGETEGRAFIVFHPADLQERFFIDFDELAGKSKGPPDPTEMEELFARHGLVLLERPPPP
ncbi:MAG: cupin domain-containing protein [Thermoplasmata archaeon]